MKNDLWATLYRGMVRANAWEQQLLRFIEQGLTSGFYHAGRGQEAVAVGACAAVRDDDYLLYDHRGLGQAIAKGIPLDRLYGDFLTRETGTTRGLGAGIVHIAWPELGILGQSGTLGGAFPIASGAALAAQMRGTDQVVICFFGEGAANRGTFLEAANVASLWKLPVIWLCENNGWSVSVSFEASSATANIADRASAYNMPGVIVDGMDVVAVHEVVAAAVARARAGEGPTLIEAKTYRFRGHYEGDPQTYREDEELEMWKKKDPILLHEQRLLENGYSEAELEAIRSEVADEIVIAADRALAAPKPPMERVFEGVLA